MAHRAAIRDEAAFRDAAARLVDLVFTDNDAYLDALPAAVEIEIVTPLSLIADALDVGHSLDDLRAAVRLFLSASARVQPQMPQDLAVLVRELRFAG